MSASYSPLPGPSGSTQLHPSAGRFNLPMPWRTRPTTSANNATTINTGSFENPSLLQALAARPLRLAALGSLALGAIILVALGTSSSTSGGGTMARIGSYASENFWALRPSSATWRQLPANEGLLDPPMTKDSKTGMMIPPDVYPAALNP